jgi:DNA-binding LacI/PurR family transcriptional regulator
MDTVAKRAGVSVATVSRALRNHPSLPEATCARIQAIAQELGYRTNPLVAALMTSQRRQKPPLAPAPVAYLSGVPSGQILETHWAARFYQGAEQRAADLGYRLEVFDLHDASLSHARLNRALITRGISGVIVGYFPSFDVRIELDWGEFAFASIGHNTAHPCGHRAENDQIQAIQRALSEAAARGYRRIGLVNHIPACSPVEGHYRMPFIDWQLQTGAPAVPVLEPEGDDFSEALVTSWYRKHRPDLVLSNDNAVCAWLSRTPAPSSVGFIALDLPAPSAELAGIVQSYQAVGACAFDLVEAQLHRNERGHPEHPKLIFLAGRWNEGASIRPKA